MQRQIFEVQKKVIGMTGNNYYVANPSGYPKIFDSHSSLYNDNIDETLLAATAAFASAWNEICTTKNCDMQSVILITADGFIIDKKVVGSIPEVSGTTQE